MGKKTNWTFEMIEGIVREGKFESRTEFKKASPNAYQFAYNREWLDRLIPSKRVNHWTRQRIRELVKKYNITTSGQLRKFNRNAYEACRRNDWFTQVGLTTKM